jgi:hypothetical protein
MAGKSFSVRIFLQDGHADGVLVVAKSSWPGRVLVLPRASYALEGQRKELNAPGVYVLIGSSAEGGLQSIYIGAAAPVSGDLQKHYEQKGSWHRAVVFTSKGDSLNWAQVQYLAAHLLSLAKEANAAHINNRSRLQSPRLSGADLAEAEAFLAGMLSIIPLLGLSAFEKSNMENSFKSI